jgi:nucleotide-binding universal stress UspA family protein
MQSISKILVPTDFSDRSLSILPYVRTFSQRYGAEVLLLHVVDPVYGIPETGITPAAIIPVPKWLFKQSSAQVETFGARELKGSPVRRFVYEGDIGTQIAETARAEGVGLVIVPTHGRGIFRRFLLGSVTAKVLHDADCPVLTGTHAQEHAHPNPAAISKIACYVDLTPQNSRVLDVAAGTAQAFGAALAIVHVIPRFNAAVRRALPGDVSDQLKEVVKGEIARINLVSPVENPDVSIEEGEVADAVCRFAKSSNADLLCIGRGSHSGEVERLAATTYAVIRQSPCPVLSV